MNDLISRQAAIDIIENYPHGEWNVEIMNDVISKIKSLPSAEQEPQKNAIELGVEYNTKDYTITIITNSTEREVDESHNKMLVREQTFKVEKNE